MGIEKYVSDFGEGVKEFGRGFYDGICDVLPGSKTIKDGLTYSVAGAVGAGIILGLISPNYVYADSTRSTVAQEEVRGDIRRELIKKIMRGPTQVPDVTFVYEKDKEQKRIVVSKWNDKNGDGRAQSIEIGDEITGTVDNSRYGLHIQVPDGSYGPVRIDTFHNGKHYVNNSEKGVMSIRKGSLENGKWEFRANGNFKEISVKNNS